MARTSDRDPAETENFETRCPKKGDRLFLESTWAFDAQIVRDPNERFYRMPMGYKRAGDLLIEQARANVVDRSNVIYPALFCYRQAIELYLKGLIDEFDGAKGERTHDLGRLWKTFRQMIDERGKGDVDALSTAQALITEMQNADKGSDGFRFPTDAGGAPFSFSDRGVDLSNVREVMQGLANFFECTALELWHREEFSQDLEA
jgi:HEPN domain-containing protein